MNAEQRAAFYRRTMISIWGILTLVLIFCVVMLVNELAARKSTIPEAPGVTAVTSTPEPERGPADLKEIGLYFADSEGLLLTEERQRFDVSTGQVGTVRAIVERLIAGPESPSLTPILPKETVLRGAYILENADRNGAELVLDFSRELEQGLPASASAEGLMAYGLVQTLCQPGLAQRGQPAITRIRFLFEGTAPDRFPRHIDLSDPLTPNPGWVAGQSAASSGNG